MPLIRPGPSKLILPKSARFPRPFGRTPGFNANHAAVIGGLGRMSGLWQESGGNNNVDPVGPTNLFDANTFVKEGSTTRQCTLAPVVGLSYTGNGGNCGYKYTGTIETPASYTAAAIGYLTRVQTIANTAMVMNNSTISTTGGFWFGWNNTGGAIQIGMQAIAGTFKGSALRLAYNQSWFIAVSINASITNFVSTNLQTGEFQNSTTTGTTFTANDGTYLIGGGAGSHMNFSYMTAGMFSTAFLTLTQMQTWQQDPWGFWYP